MITDFSRSLYKTINSKKKRGIYSLPFLFVLFFLFSLPVLGMEQTAIFEIPIKESQTVSEENWTDDTTQNLKNLENLSDDLPYVYFFWGDGCPHCEKEMDFLQNTVEKEYPDLNIYYLEIWHDRDNQEIVTDVARGLNTNVGGVPFLVIGNQSIVGYQSDNTTGKQIISLIEECRVNSCEDVLVSLDDGAYLTELQSREESKYFQKSLNISKEFLNESDGELEKRETFNSQGEVNEGDPILGLPKIGSVDLSKVSLPALAIILGFLDGFNPCAMWTLLFLISILITMKDKKKMWILGMAYIVTSAFVYFLFMTAWLNLFLLIGYTVWLRIFIGLVALGGGSYSLYKFYKGDGDGCDVVDEEKKQKTFYKLGKITSNKSFALALIGIIGLSFAVNLVELVCSAGFPAVFTQILALNNLASYEYYLYIMLYILFFMLDDLFVFFVAMLTLQMTGITTKYVKYSRLIGGILIIGLGLLLLFKPAWIMFNF